MSNGIPSLGLGPVPSTPSTPEVPLGVGVGAAVKAVKNGHSVTPLSAGSPPPAPLGLSVGEQEPKERPSLDAKRVSPLPSDAVNAVNLQEANEKEVELEPGDESVIEAEAADENVVEAEAAPENLLEAEALPRRNLQAELTSERHLLEDKHNKLSWLAWVGTALVVAALGAAAIAAAPFTGGASLVGFVLAAEASISASLGISAELSTKRQSIMKEKAELRTLEYFLADEEELQKDASFQGLSQAEQDHYRDMRKEYGGKEAFLKFHAKFTANAHWNPHPRRLLELFKLFKMEQHYTTADALAHDARGQEKAKYAEDDLFKEQAQKAAAARDVRGLKFDDIASIKRERDFMRQDFMSRFGYDYDPNGVPDEDDSAQLRNEVRNAHNQLDAELVDVDKRLAEEAKKRKRWEEQIKEASSKEQAQHPSPVGRSRPASPLPHSPSSAESSLSSGSPSPASPPSPLDIPRHEGAAIPPPVPEPDSPGH